MPLKSVDKAYIAGLIDGEGCFLIRKVGNTLQARITIANTSKEIILWLKEKCGGCYWGGRIGSKYKPLYTYEISGNKLKSFLPGITKYLIIKRKQAELTLDFLKTVKPGNKYVTQKVMQKRENIKQKIKELKHVTTS